VIRRYRGQIGSCWRKCSPGQQALLVLAHLRKGETFAELAAGFGIGTATAWRYVRETVVLLAARSPKLPAALAAARKAGHAFVVIDGTLIPIDRVAADRPFYSGKHHRHGMNLQVISSPQGEILWVSGPLPGAAHDLTAARIWGIIRQLAAAGLLVLADKGYLGAGPHVLTPYQGRNKPASQNAANSAHAKLRVPAERANAQLKTWHILRKLRCCPWRAGQLAKAIHVSSDMRDRRMKTFTVSAINISRLYCRRVTRSGEPSPRTLLAQLPMPMNAGWPPSQEKAPERPHERSALMVAQMFQVTELVPLLHRRRTSPERARLVIGSLRLDRQEGHTAPSLIREKLEDDDRQS